jgi:hypothetical protein
MKWRTLIKEEDPCMDRGVGLWEERERERERKKERKRFGGDEGRSL